MTLDFKLSNKRIIYWVRQRPWQRPAVVTSYLGRCKKKRLIGQSVLIDRVAMLIDWLIDCLINLFLPPKRSNLSSSLTMLGRDFSPITPSNVWPWQWHQYGLFAPGISILLHRSSWPVCLSSVPCSKYTWLNSGVLERSYFSKLDVLG